MVITAVTSLRPIFRPTFTVHSQRTVTEKFSQKWWSLL